MVSVFVSQAGAGNSVHLRRANITAMETEYVSMDSVTAKWGFQGKTAKKEK